MLGFLEELTASLASIVLTGDNETRGQSRDAYPPTPTRVRHVRAATPPPSPPFLREDLDDGPKNVCPASSPRKNPKDLAIPQAQRSPARRSSPRTRKSPRYSDPNPALQLPKYESELAAVPDGAATPLVESQEVKFVCTLKYWQQADLDHVISRETRALGSCKPRNDKSPPPWIGTLLAWGTGMGKTVLTIALICRTIETVPGPTLILCPNAEIAHQWLTEIRRFSRGLSVLFYHADDIDSSDYKKGQADVQSYSVVLATYHQVLRQHSEMMRARVENCAPIEKDYPFFFVRWRRVVADEAHTLRNPDGKTAGACTALKTRTTLALTATPLQNYPCDLYMQLRFLGHTCPGLEKIREFEGSSDKLFTVGNARQRISDILTECMIYRPKLSSTGTSIPDRHDYDPDYVVLSRDERMFYSYLKDVHAFKCVFAKITRLRQFCTEPRPLLGELQQGEGDDGDGEQSASKEEFEKATTDVLDVERLPAPIRHLRHLFDSSYVSRTLQMALELVRGIRARSDGKDKTIIYSTFRGPLETLSTLLSNEGVKNEIYYGNMSSEQRRAVLHQISADARCSVLLMTIQSGGTGLNITACNHVVLLEPWWNPFLEEQAVGRVHRIGQEKDVHVYRVLVKDTVQTERIVPVQEKKRAYIDQLLRDLEKK